MFLSPAILRRLVCLGLGLLALAQGGCAALAIGAVAAGAGAVGYAYYNGSVPRDYTARHPDTVWQETQNAVIDLKWPLLSATRAEGVGTIESKSPQGEPIEIRVEPSPEQPGMRVPITRVWVRVGTWGNENLSELLLAQIGKRLEAVPAVGPPAAGPTGVAPPTAPRAPTLLAPTPEPPLAPGAAPAPSQ